MIQPAYKNILAIGAHPDDVEFGCGGILLQEAEKGTRIHILIGSKGESGTNGTVEERVAESQASAKLLGAELSFLELGGDTRIEDSSENAFLIAATVRETRPNLLLCPTSVENQHPDHVSISRLTRKAARLARYGGIEELASQEAHDIDSLLEFAITPRAEPKARPDILIDISDVHQKWLQLMECHASQMQTRRYLELQEARARVWGLQAGFEYAQALYSIDAFIAENISELPGTARVF